MATETLPSLAELGGCIFTKPTKGHQGYASTMYKGKPMKRHRVVWEQANGLIPEGMQIDHVCHSVALANGMCLSNKNSTCIHRSCININHLRMVTKSENLQMASNAFGAKTHCQRGHELTEENIGFQKSGRFCKPCLKFVSARNQRKYRAQKKENI